MRIFTLLLSFVLVTSFFAQEEKGCQIEDHLRVYYEGQEFVDPIHEFSFIWPGINTSESYALDTVHIEQNAHADIGIDWIYFNEYFDMYYPAYDTLQWFYNDSLMSSSEYSFSSSETGGGCGGKYSANSKITTVKSGYYQLRSLGGGYGLNPSNYPVIHVYDKASVLNQTPQQDQIAIYPNPVNDKITVELNNPIEDLVLHIYDVNGSRIKSIDLVNVQKRSYDVNDLSKGFYFCTLYNPKNGEILRRVKLQKL